MRTPAAVHYYWHEQGLMPRWLGAMHGVAAVVLGLLLTIQPSASPMVVAESLGAYWLATGVLGFVAVMMDRTTWGVKVGSAVLGVMGGLWVIRSPLWSDAISPERSLWIAGLLGIAIGALQLLASPSDDGTAYRLVGALNVLIGIGLAFNPLGSIVALPLAAGTAALVAGATVLWVTWRSARSAPKVQPHDPRDGPSAPGPSSHGHLSAVSSIDHHSSATRETSRMHAAGRQTPSDMGLLGRRYRLEECTQVDRMWEVWRSTDVWTGRPVTIRITTQKHAEDAYVRRCNEAQVEAASSFPDPRVVPVLDAGTDECGAYLVSGVAVGLSLEELMTRGPVPTRSLTHMAMELCRLLTRARQAGAVHAPILPRTVFIGRDGSLHVNEFFVGDHEAPLPIEARPYSAPEQRTGVVGTSAEEVYNVGALLGAAARGRTPADAGARIVERGTGVAGPRREAQAGIHAIWRRAVAVRPSMRYRDLAEMMDDLRILDELQSARSRVQPAAGVLAMCIALALLAASFSTAYVTVPSVIGMDAARAVNELKRVGLVPQTTQDTRLGSGHTTAVETQVPRAGTTVAPRTIVRLSASSVREKSSGDLRRLVTKTAGELGRPPNHTTE